MAPSSASSAFSSSFSSWRAMSRRAIKLVIAETDRRLRSVLAHLRRLDLDPFPETLTTEGLEAALEELIANSDAPAICSSSPRLDSLPDEIERAIYAFVAAAVRCCPKRIIDSPSRAAGSGNMMGQFTCVHAGGCSRAVVYWPRRSGGSDRSSRGPCRVGATGERIELDRSGDPMRAVVADDIMLIRSGVARLLSDAGVEVVGEAGDAETLLRLVALERPDVAVVDIRMPPTHTDEGLAAARRIRDSVA